MARKARQWAAFAQGLTVTTGATQIGPIGTQLEAAIAQNLRGLTITRILATLEFMPGAVLADGATAVYAFGIFVNNLNMSAATAPDPSAGGANSGAAWMWHSSGSYAPMATETAAAGFRRIPFYMNVDVRAQRKVGAGETLWLVVANTSPDTLIVNLRGRALLLG